MKAYIIRMTKAGKKKNLSTRQSEIFWLHSKSGVKLQEATPALETPEFPERGVAEYVAKEIEMKTRIAIPFNSLEVVILDLY